MAPALDARGPMVCFWAQIVRYGPALLLKKKLRASDMSVVSYARKRVFFNFWCFGDPGVGLF